MNLLTWDAFESQVLCKLLEGDDPELCTLASQVHYISKRHREVSEVGFRTEFTVDEKAIPVEGRPDFVISDVVGEIDGLEFGIGFVLFVVAGRIHTLEGNTFQELWPNLLTSPRLSFMCEQRKRVWML